MYLGIDFLLDSSKNLYISEVNTGLPGGAREYDLIHRIRFKKPSGVFEKIEIISKEIFSKTFTDFIRGLPYFDELKALKIWMDGRGPPPAKIPAMLRLEDKWVQYLLLSKRFNIIDSELYDPDNNKKYSEDIKKYGGIILKRRLGRGGSGFKEVKDISQLMDLKNENIPEDFYIVQPFIESSILIKDKIHKLSIRAIVFAGRFICMFANLAPRITSNHGIRFYINPCDRLGVEDENFNIVEITEKAWEADIFYGKNIPPHLYHNLYEEDISDSFINIPDKIYKEIIDTAISISNFYKNLDEKKLPPCYLE